jgi:hypothetical protein
MESDILIQLLACLVEHPNMYSLIPANDADSLDEAGYWDWTAGTVSGAGLQCLRALIVDSGTREYLGEAIVQRLASYAV